MHGEVGGPHPSSLPPDGASVGSSPAQVCAISHRELTAPPEHHTAHLQTPHPLPYRKSTIENQSVLLRSSRAASGAVFRANPCVQAQGTTVQLEPAETVASQPTPSEATALSEPDGVGRDAKQLECQASLVPPATRPGKRTPYPTSAKTASAVWPTRVETSRPCESQLATYVSQGQCPAAAAGLPRCAADPVSYAVVYPLPIAASEGRRRTPPW
jgi:hypothetical protein